MQILSLLFGLTVVSANVFNLNDLFARDESASPSGPITHNPQTFPLCNTGKSFTSPGCSKDTECQKPGSTACNLPLPGVPAIDAIFTYGDGFCQLQPKTNNEVCSCKIDEHSDYKAYCNYISARYSKELPGLKLIGACLEQGGAAVGCDWICEGSSCPSDGRHEFPCANITSYVKGADWEPKCPNTPDPRKNGGKGASPAPGNGAPPSTGNGASPAPKNGADPNAKNGASPNPKNGAPADPKNGAKGAPK